MLEAIEKLLILQDRDRKILQLKEQLARVPPERDEHQARLAATLERLEAAKQRFKRLEADRKQLELEVEAQKQLIEKYSLQQYQTRRNEEYRALTHEIETCRATISKLEDRQLELMEQADQTQKEIAALTQTAAEVRSAVESRLADLTKAEVNLREQLAQLEANRNELAAAVEDGLRARYERLLKQRGSNVVVGIQRGVCGGCHMQVSRHLVVACIADQELVFCPNCGRLLYYTPDMDVSVAE